MCDHKFTVKPEEVNNLTIRYEPDIPLDNIVSCAVKLWKYIEKLDENGVDIRCAGKRWMIGDHWNETTEGVGNSLQEAVENLPKYC